MSHTKDIAQGHKASGVEEERMEKEVAHIPPGEGTISLWVLGELVTYKIPSQQTSGAYSLFEVTTQPGAGPPPHIHHREDESFYVIGGDYEFLIGGETLRLSAGSLIYVPRGTLHAHRGVGEGVGGMLLTQTPGGLYEHFLEEVGKVVYGDGRSLVFEEQQVERRIVKVAAEHSSEIPPPIAQ